jgi:hypothetical protein
MRRLVVLLLLAPVAAAELQFTEVRIAVPARIDSVDAEDLDGDGHRDLLVLADGHFVWFPGRAGGPATTASCRFPVPSGTVLYDLGDLDGDGDLELVTLHRDGASAFDLTPEDGARPRAGHLIQTDTVFRGGETAHPARRQVLADLRGTGTLDCLIPRARTLRVYEGDGTGRLLTPRDLVFTREGRLRIEEPWNRESGQDPSAQFVATVLIPRAQPGEAGGPPGQLDLLVVREQELRVYHRGAAGHLPVQPGLVFQIPDPERDDRRRFGGFDLPVCLGDLDGDGYTDVVMPDAAGGRVAVHRSRSGAFVEKPDELLTVPGWLGGIQLEDLDRDGLDDLLLVRLDELSIWDLLAIVTKQRVPVEVSVFLATGGGQLADRPAFRQAVDIPLILGGVGHGMARIEAAFVPAATGDHNGDGVRDIVLLGGRDRLRIVGAGSAPGHWQTLAEPRVRGLSELQQVVPSGADLNGDGCDDLVLVCHAWEGEDALRILLTR